MSEEFYTTNEHKYEQPLKDSINMGFDISKDGELITIISHKTKKLFKYIVEISNIQQEGISNQMDFSDEAEIIIFADSGGKSTYIATQKFKDLLDSASVLAHQEIGLRIQIKERGEQIIRLKEYVCNLEKREKLIRHSSSLDGIDRVISEIEDKLLEFRELAGLDYE